MLQINVLKQLKIVWLRIRRPVGARSVDLDSSTTNKTVSRRYPTVSIMITITNVFYVEIKAILMLN